MIGAERHTRVTLQHPPPCTWIRSFFKVQGPTPPPRGSVGLSEKSMHLNRTRQYGQSIVNAILYKPFEQGGSTLKSNDNNKIKKREKTNVCKDSSPPKGVVSGRVLGHRCGTCTLVVGITPRPFV